MIINNISPMSRQSLWICRRSMETNQTNLKGEVVNLYKNLLYLSRDWHTDLRPQIKRAFMKNKDLTDAEEIKKQIAKGEYICREITATYYLKKYRTLKRRYYSDETEKKDLQEILKEYNQ